MRTSRPVMEAFLINKVENENTKLLDVNDDDALLHKLKMGKHLPGLASRQVKRVDKLTEHYKWENDKIWYKIDSDREEYLMVPRKEERRNIIENAHLLGHFQVEATAARIREKYYWKRMHKDIETVIKLCKQCKEYKIKRHVYLPAKATESN